MICIPGRKNYLNNGTPRENGNGRTDERMQWRQKKLLDMAQNGKVLIRAAALQFGVTEMTVRRDLLELEKQKLLLRVKGGAVLHPACYEPEWENIELPERKFAIAEALLKRILPVDSLFLSTGSTTLAFARLRARRRGQTATVITNSLPVASTLFHSRCKVILLGGELRNNSLDLVGPAAERNLEEYHVDWLVSGCDGIFADYGFYTSDVRLSDLEKKSLNIAEHAAVITDSTKFGKRSLTRFASLKEIELLVTDDELPEADERKLRGSGIEIIKVPVR